MLIEVSGIDGSGKSTLIDAIVGWCQRSGVMTCDWTLRSATRRIVEAIGLADHPQLASRLAGSPLELAVCIEFLREVNAVPTVQLPGQLILVDNYVRGWLANAAQSDTSLVEDIALLYREFIPSPALSIELTVDPNRAYARILSRKKLDPCIQAAGIQYLERRLSAFVNTRDLCGYPVDIVDADQSESAVFTIARELILYRTQSVDPKLWPALHGTSA